MAIRFDGKVAVVTGAGRGIGRAYALGLASRGARVVVVDVGASLDGRGADEAVAAGVAAEIRARGGAAVAVCESVATIQGGRAITEAALDAFGGLDILINNAGNLRDRSFLKMTEAEWDDIMAVHLKGAFSVTQPALARMKAAGYGRIVFTSSTSGLFGNFGQTNYGSAKMGVVGLMNSLVIEMAGRDVGINTVAPTAATRMTEGLFKDGLEERMAVATNVPLVLYLVSAENRETGMVFCMKGGWYSRTAVVCGQGVCFEPGVVPEPEEIASRFREITELEGAVPLKSGAETLRFMK